MRYFHGLYSLLQAYEVGFIIVLILQLEKQRLKDLAQITQLVTEVRYKPLQSGYTAHTPASA